MLLSQADRAMLKLTEELMGLLYAHVYFMHAEKDRERAEAIASALDSFLAQMRANERVMGDRAAALRERVTLLLNVSRGGRRSLATRLAWPHEARDLYVKLKPIREGFADAVAEAKLPLHHSLYLLRTACGYVAPTERAMRAVADLKTDTFVEESFHSYLSGLYHAQAFHLLIDQYSSAHHPWLSRATDSTPVVVPRARKTGEAGLRLLLLPNEKNVVFALHLHEEPVTYGYLTSTTAHFRKLNLYYPEGNHYERLYEAVVRSVPGNVYANPHSIFFGIHSWDNPLELLWKYVFESPIAGAFSRENEPRESLHGQTLNQVLTTAKVHTIRYIPSAWLLSFPLSAARSAKEARWAAQRYRVSYLTDKSSRGSSSIQKGSVLLVCDQLQSTLTFLHLEIEFLSRLLGNRLNVLTWDSSSPSFEVFRETLFEQAPQHEFVVFACHADNALFFQRDGGPGTYAPATTSVEFPNFKSYVHRPSGRVMVEDMADHHIDPSDLATLNWSGCNILLSCCFGTRSNWTTTLEDAPVSSAFALGGAESVLCTTSAVSDYDAFRVTSRVMELVFRERCGFADAYHQLCLEGIEGRVPNRLSFVEQSAPRRQFAVASYLARAMEVNWQSYVLWESH